MPNSIRAYSFDVFDTCISRMHAYPKDLFFDVGLRLASPEHSERASLSFARRFQRARILAEKVANARVRPIKETADIFEIYRVLRFLLRDSRSISELVDAELAAEERSIYPITQTVDRIRLLRDNGNRIIFVSDMYIPAHLLGPILRKNGVMQTGDGLYVSCDYGVTKRSGSLFRKALQLEKLPASSILHTGDNVEADIRMAEKLGINAKHFSSAHLSKKEILVAGSRLPRLSGGTFLSSLSRRIRLGTATGVHWPLDEMACTIVVPFLLAYVAWLLEDARQRGIKRLYFVARDGEILYKVAKSMCALDSDIELRYLFGSRRAWLQPSIDPQSREWARIPVMSGVESSRRAILARIGLSLRAQDRIRHELSITDEQWEAQLSRKDSVAFLDLLQDNARTSELLLNTAAEQRVPVLRYLESEGVFDTNVNWALVDSGWALNSQAALKRLLALSGKPHSTPEGYYVGIQRDRLSEHQAGTAYPFVPKVGSYISRRRIVFEHFFLPATHTSTMRYELDGDRALPVLGQETRSAQELEYARTLHAIAESAATLVGREPSLFKDLIRHRSAIIANAERFIRYPDKETAEAASSFGASPDMRQESAQIVQMCTSLQLKDIWTVLQMTFSSRKAFQEPAFMWLEGSMALSSLPVRLPLHFMLVADSLRNSLRDRLMNLQR